MRCSDDMQLQSSSVDVMMCSCTAALLCFGFKLVPKRTCNCGRPRSSHWTIKRTTTVPIESETQKRTFVHLSRAHLISSCPAGSKPTGWMTSRAHRSAKSMNNTLNVSVCSGRQTRPEMEQEKLQQETITQDQSGHWISFSVEKFMFAPVWRTQL